MLTPGDPSQVAAELPRSAELSELIRARAAAKGGWLPFSEYMEAALYEPGLGYYMTGRPIFGATGDFITAPELSPLFSACLANGVGNLLAAAGGGDIVEFGAGSGRMAEELFGELASRGGPPARYRIVEPSTDARTAPANADCALDPDRQLHRSIRMARIAADIRLAGRRARERSARCLALRSIPHHEGSLRGSRGHARGRRIRVGSETC